MNFNEPDKNVITLPKYESCFVYFLIKKNEVVYVGQTSNGIARPYSHKDKDFDEIKILYCDKNALDFTEDFYIEKYAPIYNKQRNYAAAWGLYRVRNSIRKTYGISDYTIPRLRKLLKTLNIVPKRDVYTGKDYITFEQYKFVMNYLKEQTS